MYMTWSLHLLEYIPVRQVAILNIFVQFTAKRRPKVIHFSSAKSLPSLPHQLKNTAIKLESILRIDLIIFNSLR
jgi:hypothetical protein